MLHDFKELFTLKRKILRHPSAFLARLSILLNEGYTFYDAIYLLLPHHLIEYEAMLNEIEGDFRGGLSATEILQRLGYSKSVLLPVVIAEKEGSLAKSLTALADRLDKKERAKKKVQTLLAYPAVLFVFMTALLIVFRSFFLPNMKNLIQSRPSTDTSFLTLLPTIVAKLPDIIIGFSILLLLLFVAGLFYYRKLSALKRIHFFTRIPIAGNLFLMSKTRLFASEIGSLLDSGFALQDGLAILMEQELDSVLGEIATTVQEQVKYGEPFHLAVSMTDGLTKQLQSFAEHGENSGHLSKELLIYSEHLDDEMNRRMEKGLALIQPLLFSLVAICILAAYLALILPIYGMLDHF